MTDLQEVADKGLLVGVPLPAKTGKARERVQALLAEIKCDPFLILAQISQGDSLGLGIIEEISVADRKDAAKELCNYLAPKLRSIEHIDTDKVQGGVMMIPGIVSMDQWAEIVKANKIKTIEAEVVS